VTERTEKDPQSSSGSAKTEAHSAGGVIDLQPRLVPSTSAPSELEKYLDRRQVEFRALAGRFLSGRRALATLEAALAKQQLTIRESDAERRDLQATVQQLEQRLAALETEPEDDGSVERRLRELLNYACQRREEVQGELESHRAERDSLREQLEVQAGRLTALSARVAVKQDVIRTLEAQMNRATADAEPENTPQVSGEGPRQPIQSMETTPLTGLDLTSVFTESSPATSSQPPSEATEFLHSQPEQAGAAREEIPDVSEEYPMLVAVIDERMVRCPLQKPCMTIGRDFGNDIQLFRKHVSRRHARIVTDGSSATVEDLGSKNGVIVAGERVDSHRLRDGDTFIIGGICFKFRERSKRATP
jgi:hypothetical protein